MHEAGHFGLDEDKQKFKTLDEAVQYSAASPGVKFPKSASSKLMK